MMIRTSRFRAGLALAAAVLAGCGAQDDDGGAPEAEPPAPARIVRFAPTAYADSVPVALAAFCQQALPSPAGPPVQVDTLAFGPAPRTMMRIERESHLDLPLRCVVRTRREWDVVRPLTSIYADGELPPAPSVDFGREMLVVAAMGFRPTYSYDIWADGSWMRGDTL